MNWGHVIGITNILPTMTPLFELILVRMNSVSPIWTIEIV